MLGVPATISTPDSTARASQPGRPYSVSQTAIADPERRGDRDRRARSACRVPIERVEEAAALALVEVGLGVAEEQVARRRYWSAAERACRARSRRRSAQSRMPGRPGRARAPMRSPTAPGRRMRARARPARREPGTVGARLLGRGALIGIAPQPVFAHRAARRSPAGEREEGAGDQQHRRERVERLRRTA